MTIKFKTGQTYSTRSICDYDCIFSFRVIGRTDKTVKIIYHGKEGSKKITIRNGVETIKPLGSYSMAPVLGADDTSDKIEAQLQRAATLAAERAEAARARFQ